MKRTVNPFVVFVFVIITITGFHACSKDSDKEDCRTCKAIGPDQNIVDEATICSESEETAFRNENPGKEIMCD